MQNDGTFQQTYTIKYDVGTKGDFYTYDMIDNIIENHDGSLDINPRPKYKDGTPAHTFSINHVFHTYNIAKGDSPFVTLRPIAIKSAIGEILWIYQDMSNDLDLLKEKYNVTWWDDWDIGDRTIGCCYGETVRRHNLINNLLDGLKEDPDGRRHIMELWQVEDFKNKHGLKPCCHKTNFNVRHYQDEDYLDMLLDIRSSDYLTALTINEMQYLVLLHLVARHCGYKVGKFSVVIANAQIYDRHIKNAKIMADRFPVSCSPKIWLNPDKTDFFSFTMDDIEVMDIPLQLIRERNPQLKFELGI
jgi:thymidylate synthase